MFFIKGETTLAQYFLVMLVSTVGLVGVTIASYLVPYDKTTVTVLMMILSVISISSSAKIIADTAKSKGY